MIELIARANAMAVLEVELLSSRSQLESPEGLSIGPCYSLIVTMDYIEAQEHRKTQTRKEWRMSKIGINKQS
jgi:hypothetical protein